MDERQFNYDVFLSHSSKDKTVVRPLAERLRHDGLKVWFDEWIPSPAGAGEGGRRPGEGRQGKSHSRGGDCLSHRGTKKISRLTP